MKKQIDITKHYAYIAGYEAAKNKYAPYSPYSQNKLIELWHAGFEAFLKEQQA
jgi:hypothetical protein